MKVAIITDQHFGARKNSKLFHDYFLKFYNDIFFPYLEENDIKVVIDMGDTFDSRKGIDFSAQTASDTGNTTAEILDHYEEGSWTPAFEGTSTSVTVHSAKYTRIGRIVHVTCYFSGMTASNNGSMQKVTGLPFDHTASTYAALSLGYCGTVNLNDALPIITSNYIYFHQNDGNSAVLTRADFYSRAGGVFPLLMSGVYMTDE